MQVGRYQVSLHVHGKFKLDGGAMFGSVPKPLWSRQISADDQNRIPLCARSLIIECENRKILVDVGCGDFWDEKSKEIFCFEPDVYEVVPGVTDVILTHLHFDHAGGVLGKLGQPNYPDARFYVSRANLENAKSPNLREKASYLPQVVSLIENANLVLLEDGDEPFDGISVHQVHGHTVGLQWVQVSDEGKVVAFPSDLFPTAHHLPLPYVMGYDICAATSLVERQSFLERAIEERWLVVFQHDWENDIGTVSLNEKGKPEFHRLELE